MSEIALTRSASRSRPGLVVGLLLVCVAAYAMTPVMPLYFDNQNTKLLFGLAKAGVGRLSEDWIVAQGSELPIFDALVYFTYRLVGPYGFYIWHFVAFAAYTVAIYGLARTVGVTKPETLGRDACWFLPIFAACWIGLNANDGALKAFEGFGHQYLNGKAFEPQAFGILALVGLLLFRLGWAGWSVVLIVTAAWLHPTYSIAGLMLLAGMAAARWRRGPTVNLPFLTLAGGIVGCLAAAGFAYSLLQPTDPVAQAEATRLIAEFRIPHHSLPEAWLDDGDPQIKLLVIAFVVWLIWRDPLAWVLAVATACVVVLTLWVYVTRDMQLALAAPWRASAIIVPAANAILLGRLIQFGAVWTADNAWRRKATLAALAAVLAVLIAVGQRERIARYQERRSHPDYFGWVRDNARDGDLFLTSADQLEFRLATGQPQYVTHKTHPYKGRSVRQWFDRLKKAQAVTGTVRPACGLLDSLAAEAGVTHIVRAASVGDPQCSGWPLVYEDEGFVILHHRS